MIEVPVAVQVLFALGLLVVVVVRFAALRRGGSLDPLAQWQEADDERRRREGGTGRSGDGRG